MARGIGSGQRRRPRHQIHPDPEGAWPLGQHRQQQAARAGAEVQHPQRRPGLGEGVQRGLDQGFGIGARDQRGRGDREVQGPEPLGAEDMRHRHRIEPRGERRSEPRGGLRRYGGAGVAQQGFRGRAHGVAQQQARFQARAFDRRRAQHLAGLAEEGADGLARLAA